MASLSPKSTRKRSSHQLYVGVDGGGTKSHVAVMNDAEEIIGKARTGILPIFKNQPGFVAYGVMVRGNQLISMSAWKSEGDAKAADELAREWVSQNVDMTVVNSFVGDYEWLEFAQQ